MVSRSSYGRSREPRQALGYIETSELFATASRLMALERDLAELQPRLALKPVRLANQTLTVTASSAGVAARLRQFEPSLLAGLRARGWLVNKVRFRAATRFDAPPAVAPRAKDAVSASSLAALERLAQEQRDGDGLKQALAAFVARHRGYGNAPGRR
ncbi:MAG: DciA family protein [Lautropia sp.]